MITEIILLALTLLFLIYILMGMTGTVIELRARECPHFCLGFTFLVINDKESGIIIHLHLSWWQVQLMVIVPEEDLS